MNNDYPWQHLFSNILEMQNKNSAEKIKNMKGIPVKQEIISMATIAATIQKVMRVKFGKNLLRIQMNNIANNMIAP